MIIKDTSIPDLKVIQKTQIHDDRGSFSRLFCDENLSEVLNNKPIRHINSSYTKYGGTIRGLHFQRTPMQETKIIYCIKGRIFDVAIDLRQHSGTYLNHHSQILTPENGQALAIPEGFAHGFQALEADTEIIYFNTNVYSPDHEAGLRYDDPRLNIAWPLTVTHVSNKDKKWRPCIKWR